MASIMLQQILQGIGTGLVVVCLPVLAWQLVLALRGVFPMLRQTIQEDKTHRFAVLICARNEEAVIGNLIDSLHAQAYPQDCFSVFVIADNCTDGTAQAARAHGALVYERFNQREVGKGFALHWAFEQLRTDYPGRYDAAAIFDADNLVDPHFLEKANEALCAGADIVQGYRDTKNVADSTVSSCYAIYWLMLTRFYHRARYNWGLPCQVGGTGFAFKMDCVADGWNTHTIAEDSEFSIHQICEGKKIVPVYDAVFYDEQPTTWSTSFRQRYRWVVGSVQAIRYEFGHICRSIPKVGMAAVDALMYQLAIFAIVLMMISGFFSGAALIVSPPMDTLAFQWGVIWMSISLIGGFLGMSLVALVTVLLERKPLKLYWKGIVAFPIFLFPMAYLLLLAFFRPKAQWKPIAHTDSKTISDMSQSEN